jgi:outer membrane protein
VIKRGFKFGIGALFLATSVSGALLEVDVGAGGWSQQWDGYLELGGVKNYFNNSGAEGDQNPNTGNFGLESQKNGYFYFRVVHPLPLLPNFRFQYTNYNTSGRSSFIAGNLKLLGKVEIPVSLTDAETHLELDSYDLTLFYQLSNWINLGVGVDLWKGSLKITGKDQLGETRVVEGDFTLPIPYLYGRVETPPVAGFSIVASGKWASFNENHHYDWEGAVKYLWDLPGPIDPYIRVGYRYKELKWVDGEDQTLLKIEGPFAEVAIEF